MDVPREFMDEIRVCPSIFHKKLCILIVIFHVNQTYKHIDSLTRLPDIGSVDGP